MDSPRSEPKGPRNKRCKMMRRGRADANADVQYYNELVLRIILSRMHTSYSLEYAFVVLFIGRSTMHLLCITTLSMHAYLL